MMVRTGYERVRRAIVRAPNQMTGGAAVRA
jgi:hypothetical protein